MPNLLQSLQGRDIGFLRLVAQLWGVDLISVEPTQAQVELASKMLKPGMVAEVVGTLPSEAGAALQALIQVKGRMPWVVFSRLFGEVREAGPGRRDREKYPLHPVSSAEVLFYRALVARAFFEQPGGSQEFVYIPDDLLAVISGLSQRDPKPVHQTLSSNIEPKNPLGRAALPREYANIVPASDRILDDATTFLAALRMGNEPPVTPTPRSAVRELLASAGILQEGKPLAEPVRAFLEACRSDALEMLKFAWSSSETFNELRQVPGLIVEGAWENDPLNTRTFLLNTMAKIPQGRWWSLHEFIRSIKETSPDFQRPVGDYDSWFIKREIDQAYLRGFSHWDEVDGALIHFFITGPLFWLKVVDLATQNGDNEVSAFRILNDKAKMAPAETGRLHVNSTGKITLPRTVARVVRYQIARFCEWEAEKPDEYRYFLTAGSLKRSMEQGLTIGQLLPLLAKNSAAEIPPSLIKALKRWEKYGVEARIEVHTILHFSRPEVMEELRRSKASRFLGETLGPVTMVVKSGAQAKVLSTLLEMGLLAEDNVPNPPGGDQDPQP